MHQQPPPIDNHLTLCKEVIEELKTNGEICMDDFPIDAVQLNREYTFAQTIAVENIDCDDIDMVVVLSGRSGFSGTYVEKKDKAILCPTQFDPTDTSRRLAYGVAIAKKGMENNRLKGIDKPIYVYFNGLAQQNCELRELLKKNSSYCDYPAELFIVDTPPFDNTLGQVIGFSYFLNQLWPDVANRFQLNRPPYIAFSTSSYHAPRASLTIGENSPLHTASFWQNHPTLFNRLSLKMQQFVMSHSSCLKQAQIIVLGCDRQISATPYWEKDLRGDMQARINYSMIRQVGEQKILPSIAKTRAINDVTLQKTK